jgi:hypothetical protein
VKRAVFAGIGAFLALPWADLKRPLRRDADFQEAPDRDARYPAVAEILVAARQRVSVGRSVWTDLVRPQAAFLEERLADFGRDLDQDAPGIDQAVLSAADLRALAHPERLSRELKKPLPDASSRGRTVVPCPFLKGTGGLVAQSVAQLAKPKARRAESQPQLPWQPAKRSDAPAQTEPVQGAPRQVRVMFLPELLANLEQHAQSVPGQVQRASRGPRQAARPLTLRLSWPPPLPLPRPLAHENVFAPARHAQCRVSSSGSFSP